MMEKVLWKGKTYMGRPYITGQATWEVYRENLKEYDQYIASLKQHPAPWLKPEDDGKDKVEGVDFCLRKRGIYQKGRYHYICKICSNEFADVDTLLCKQCSDETIAVPLTPSPSEQQPVDMTVEEFYSGFNLDFLSEEEKQTIYTATELYAKGKLRLATPPSGSDEVEFAEWILKNCVTSTKNEYFVYNGDNTYSIRELYDIFINSKK